MKDDSPKKVLVEVCVDTLASALSAQGGAASRVELCSALSEGGLTPSAGIIAEARHLLKIDIFVMIRPRAGNFVYSQEEFAAMLQDIKTARQLGADGIVTGILNPDGSLDEARIARLVIAAKPMPVTFHRAFDITPDPFKALEGIIASGCKRILTSGQQITAIEGKEIIHELIQQASGRIIIVPGSGVNEHNVGLLISSTGAVEVHLSGRKPFKPTVNNTKSEIEKVSFHPQYETDPNVIHSVIQEANSAHIDNS
ncbi:MAG: copper homeostasis protein CutC [Bacteroidales bacterium]